jgi:hypothetical protein
MTGQEFMAWMEDHGCFRDWKVDGFNVTGFGVVYRKKDTPYFIYFSGPFDDERRVPSRDIRDGCDQLHIPRPPSY